MRVGSGGTALHLFGPGLAALLLFQLGMALTRRPPGARLRPVLAVTTAGAFLVVVVVPLGLGRNGGAASAAIPAGIAYYHTNHLGSTVLANPSGDGVTSLGFENTHYRPYGKSTGAAPEFAFTGPRFLAGIGLHHFGARWYDAAMGRFLQPDPLVPEPFNPQSLNRYSYVLNDPVNRVDPTGMVPRSITEILPDGWQVTKTIDLQIEPGPIPPFNPNLLGDTVGRIITSLGGGLGSTIGSFDAAQAAIASQSQGLGSVASSVTPPPSDGFRGVVALVNAVFPDQIVVGGLAGLPFVFGGDLEFDTRDVSAIRLERVNFRFGFGGASQFGIRSLSLLAGASDESGTQFPVQVGAIVAGQLPGTPFGAAFDARVGLDLRGSSVSGGVGFIQGGAVCAPCVTISLPIGFSDVDGGGRN